MAKLSEEELKRLVSEIRIYIRKEHPSECEIDITPFVCRESDEQKK